MTKELSYYVKLAEDMIAADVDRDKANLEYDRMDHNDWSLPSTLRAAQWVRAFVSTDPHDAIATGTRVLSSLDEKLTVQPLASDQANKRRANEWEQCLTWIMKQINRRRQGTVLRSLVRSCLKYDEAVCQVIYLPYRIQHKEAFGIDAVREKAALRYGNFAVEIYHPNNVHVRYSTMMPEDLLLCQTRTAQDVIDEWGELANRHPEIQQWAEKRSECKYYDYWNYEDHVVWVASNKSGGGIVEIARGRHELPFLGGWVARIGGDTLEAEAKHRRRPLLYSVMTSRQWEAQNIIESIFGSEAIAYGAAPRAKEEGPVEEHITSTDYGTVNRTVDVTPGNVWTQLTPPPMDRALAELDDRISARIAKSTVANVLMGGDSVSGESFAALNLRTQTALGSIKAAQELAEQAMADIYTNILLWAEHTGDNVYGYGSQRSTFGSQYMIEAEQIDPTGIYLEVKLKPDVPLDRLQQANVAMMLVNSKMYPKERALEDMGVNDPDAALKQVYYEGLVEYLMQTMYEVFGQTFSQPPEQAPGLESIQNEAAGAPGGESFNPAMGGLPPAEAAPWATREGVTGEDMMGNEMFPPGMGGL